MSTPRPDDPPTRMLPRGTVPPPSVTSATATRRAPLWQRKLPARIGRARTSTVVIGCLFLLLYALNAGLPQPDLGTTDVVLPSGRTVAVPNTALPSDAVPTTIAPAPSSTVPTEDAPATSSEAPTSSPEATATDEGEDEDEGTTTPRRTGTTTGSAPTSSTAPTSGREPTSSSDRTSTPTAESTAEPTASAPTS